jgi:hypothetical protein
MKCFCIETSLCYKWYSGFLNLVEMWEFHIQISSTPQCHCILLKKYGSDILSLSRVKVCQFRLFHSWISFITQWCLNTETFHKLLILSNRVIVVNSKSAISWWFNRSVFISSAVDCGSSPSWVKPKTIDWYLLILC